MPRTGMAPDVSGVHPYFGQHLAGDPAKYARDFYDLQTGSNGAYQAGPGWDYVSGWGVPDVANLAADVDSTMR